MTRTEPAPLTGRTLGDFVIREKLGEGGNGVVYRAEQRGLGREAVVKVLRARHADERVVARFLREAQLASKLDHPYAAHIYAFGAEPDGVMWIAMELVRGTPLSKVLAAQSNARMPIARWVGLLGRIAEVVHTAHEQGIVHRDLKPDNIMVLSRAGRLLPKLLDLGVAKLTLDPTETDAAVSDDEARDVRLTQDGARIGSPFYMAPEQWSDGEIDPRTDLYALGVMTYEALAGCVPFGGATVTEIARAHLRGEPSALPADVPAAVGDVVRRALARDRDARPATALAFAEAVRAAAGLRVGADTLPRLDEGLRADAAWLPQPIAEAIDAIEAARNPHQARDALWEIVRVAARWLGVVALAARSRSGPGPGTTDDAPAAKELLRAMPRRDLTDDEWLELVRALGRPFASARDAHPIPELVDFAMVETSPFAPLLALRAAETHETSEESLREWLGRTLPVLAPLVRALGFLTDYQLVVRREAGGELWMGARKPRRPLIHVGDDVPIGAPALVDLDGRAVLALSPLVAIAAPAPGAAEELFVFAGPGRARSRGARMVAEPHGFERHDDGVWDWFRAHLLAVDDAGAARADEDAPYRGLAAFTEKDADRFFGRERQAEAFVNQLLVTPLVAVVGPSGAGKSSFVQAGVVPALPAGWRAVTLRPGAAPMASWSARVDLSSVSASASETLVIVVDQFEELFTLGADAEERERFAKTLIAAAADPRVRVVLTLRDDFLVRAGELVALRDRLAHGLTLLATPALDDLLRIVTEPAKRAGYDFDDKDLPARMVRAVAGQPGALALLSFTAAQLWELRDRHFQRLTRKAYDAIGGVEGALAAHADATLAASTADEQRLARDAFRHLVTAEGTRAVLTRAELSDVLGRSSHASALVERLVKARLLVASEDDRIEIIHEALITAWPRLVQWRRDDAEGARLRDQLRAAARQWADRDKPRGLLWRDDALDDYRRWRTRWPGALPELDEAFAAASLRDAARGRRLRRTLAITAATILLAATAALALLYRSSNQNARTAQDRLVSSYVEQGRSLLLDGDYQRALPYLSAAYSAGDDSLGLRTMLHRAMKLADTPYFDGAYSGAALRGKDELLAITLRGQAEVWNISGHRRIATLPARADASDGTPFDLSRDGARVAIVAPDAVVIWDGRETRRIDVSGGVRVAFEGDSPNVAIATKTEVSMWTSDGAREWASPLPSPALQLVAFDDAVAVWSRDQHIRLVRRDSIRDLGPGTRIAHDATDVIGVLTQDTVEVWDAHGTHLSSIKALEPSSAVFTRDGKTLAISSVGGAISLFDTATGAAQAVLSGHRAQARLVFTPDGKRLISASEDQTVRIWNVAAHGQYLQLAGPGGDILGIAAGTDGTRAVVIGGGMGVYPLQDPAASLVIDVGESLGIGGFTRAGDKLFLTTDAAVEVRDTKSGNRLARIETGPADGSSIDPDGKVVAIPLADAPVTELRELATGAVRARLATKDSQYAAVQDHGGARVATVGDEGAVDLWDTAGRHLATLAGHTGPVFSAAFDAGDRRLATVGYGDRTVRVWDVASRRELGHVSTEDGPFTVAFDPSGDRLLTATDDPRAQLWDLRSFTLIRTFEHPSAIRSAVFSPDGRLIATGARNGTVAVWDAESGEEVARFHHALFALYTSFSPDGRRLLSTSTDHFAILWDVTASVPSPDEVRTFARCHVPYELRGTALQRVARPDCL